MSEIIEETPVIYQECPVCHNELVLEKSYIEQLCSDFNKSKIRVVLHTPSKVNEK